MLGLHNIHPIRAPILLYHPNVQVLGILVDLSCQTNYGPAQKFGIQIGAHVTHHKMVETPAF